MDDEERTRTLVIQASGSDIEPSHVEILLRLYWRVSKSEKEPVLVHLKKDHYLDDLTKPVYEKNFDDFFDFRRLSKTHRASHLHEKIRPERVAAESKLMQAFRVCSVEEFGDSIFIDKELAKCPEKLFEIFDTVSSSKMFLELPELHYTPIPILQAKQSDSKKAEPWFDMHSSNTLAAVFLGFLEHWIILRYCFFTRFIRSQKKDSLPVMDMVLPWKNSKDMPGLLKEFPEALKEGIEMAGKTFEQQSQWYTEESGGKIAKNPSRQRLMFKMSVHCCPSGGFEKLSEKEQGMAEIVHHIKTEPKERLIESMLCPTLEQFGTATSLVLHAVGQDWIELLSNLKISKFQECESNKAKKKKKKVRRKKIHAEIVEPVEGEMQDAEKESLELVASNNGDSLPLSTAPYGKTIADEDTRCANGSCHSTEKPEVNKDLFSVDNMANLQDSHRALTDLKPEISAPQPKNLIKKKIAALRKEELKREKKKMKRKQQKEAAKLKKVLVIIQSESSSFGSCSPLEKASCLSVAGSGVILNFESQIVREPIFNSTGNLILKQRQCFFDDEDAPEVNNRSTSLCTAGFATFEPSPRPFSFDSKRKYGQMTQYGLMRTEVKAEIQMAKRPLVDKVNLLRSKTGVTDLSDKKKPLKLPPKQTDSALSKQVEMASNTAVTPQVLGITKCVYEERHRMRQANYNITAGAELRSGFRRVSRQNHNSSSFNDIYEQKSGRPRRVPPSVATDKPSHHHKNRGERRFADKGENHSLSGTAASNEQDIFSIPNRLKGQMQQNQLLLKESLNLPHFIEGAGMGIDLFQRHADEEYYGSSYNMGMPYLCPVQEEDKSGIVVVPDCVLDNPTVVYLESEARRFVHTMEKQSEELEVVRRICKERIELVAKVSFMGTDDLTVKTYGSWDTGLSIPGSDIDLMISTPGVDKDVALQMLETLGDNLRDFGWTAAIKNISSAQIPVLKVKVNPCARFTSDSFPDGLVCSQFLAQTNQLASAKKTTDDNKLLSVDIIIETADISALQTTQYVVDSCARWSELRGLVLMLKYFLSKRGLTNPYTGKVLFTQAASAAMQSACW